MVAKRTLVGEGVTHSVRTVRCCSSTGLQWTSDSLWVETADTPSGVSEAGPDLLSFMVLSMLIIVSKKEVTSGWIEVLIPLLTALFNFS